MPKLEKHLYSVQSMKSGNLFGSKWIFKFNGMILYQNDQHSNQVILFVPSNDAK